VTAVEGAHLGTGEAVWSRLGMGKSWDDDDDETHDGSMVLVYMLTFGVY